MKTQEQVWDNIAPDWHEKKQMPSPPTTKFLNNSKGKILNLGGGSGRNLLKLRKNKNRTIYLLDFSKKMLKLAEERAKEKGINIQTIHSEMDKIPFEDNFFDAAVSIAAIHCIETKAKRKKAIKELFRVLKKGAQAEIEVWNFDSKRFKNSKKEKFINWTDKGKRYYYLYEEKEIHDLFKEAGFKIKEKLPSSINIVFIVEK
jgi:ubiquinone/menaquinone biosynthesis C-methylase UbiE